MVVLRIVGPAWEGATAEDWARCGRQYIRSFRPGAPGSRGMVGLTTEMERARRFPDAGAAAAYWCQSNGRRRDGRPNCPLTAYTVEIVELPPPSQVYTGRDLRGEWSAVSIVGKETDDESV